MGIKETTPLVIGMKGYASLDVEEEHTALHVGSGCERVLATPVLIALMEAAAVDCVEHRLEVGQTSLGIHVCIDHKAPTPIGHSINVTAELSEIKGKTVKFNVHAEDKTRIVGSGVHIRAIVLVEEFRKRLAALEK